VSHPLYTPAEDHPLLADLNPAQREAVTAPEGPLLLVAGAGTGKTRVLTRRVAWKVEQGASPSSVLAITFTNKAANVMKERLGALRGGDGVTAGTFHSFCALLLRRFADRIGRARDFTILDAEDQGRLLRDLLDDFKIDTTAHRPQAFAAAISHQKNGGAGRPPASFSDARFLDHLRVVAPAYGERLVTSGLFDFDDLLLEAGRLLKDVPDVAEEARARWRHVLVDEYQDTNGIQFDLLKALVGPRPDLTVVGDPDQSIYRWRGASLRNILRFEADFEGARIVKLEENYRSTRRVLAAAEAVVSKNRERYEKRLRTSNAEGERIVEMRFRDPAEESQGVVRTLASWREGGTPWSEMAVFVRVNHASRGIETALRTAGVPYAVVSGTEFFQRKEVKDVLAYARLLENPRDEAAFSRVVNAPRRGVGETSLARVRAIATERGVSVPEAATLAGDAVSGKARKGLDRLLACLARLRAWPKTPIGPLFEAIVTETGYRADLEGREDDLERSRVENVDELVSAAREADRTRPGITLSAFLETVALASEQDGFDEAAGRVSVMTVHAAKGLEFDGVVVLGAEEGWFPHARSADRPEDLEEERRLFYVAMTRARKRLALTHVGQRQGWQGVERRLPSRFLADVPDDLVEVRDGTGLYARDRARGERRGIDDPRRARGFDAFDEPPADDACAHDTGPARPPGRAPQGDALRGRAARGLGDPRGGAGSSGAGSSGAARPDRTRDAPRGGRAAPASEDGDAVFERGASADAACRPAPGDRVAHPYFGEGRLVSTSGTGSSQRVTVDFDAVGTKTILVAYAQLTRVGGPPGATP